jgi:hypothetical protein
MNTSETIISVGDDQKIELPPEIQRQLQPGQYKISITEDTIILKKVQKSSTWAELSHRIEALGEDPQKPTLQEISEMAKEVRREKKNQSGRSFLM